MTQDIQGQYNAQASDGSNATVNVFQGAAPAPLDPGLLTSGLEALDGLPLDAVPEIAPLPDGSRPLFGVNPLFVGREDELRTLACLVKEGGTAAVGQIAAATGLGGIGKTQLASEFVHRYGQFFAGGVFWINFAEANAIASEIALCGGAEGMNLKSGFGNLPLDDQVGLVASHWRNGLPRLLVFDNCEDEKLLQQWRPVSGNCIVLVTSRRQEWSPALGVGALSLGVLERGQSIALLRGHRPDLSEDDPIIGDIAEELGDLPLALHLAGSFLHQYRHAEFGAPASYLDSIRDTGLLAHQSLTRGDFSPTNHEQHVGRTFKLSYDRLEASDRIDGLALAALSRAACFAPGEAIPRDLLCASFLPDPEEGRDATMDAEDALRRLVSLGLIEQQADGKLWLHRLVVAFVQAADGEINAARDDVEQTVFHEANRLNKEGYPGPLLAWQPHLQVVTEAAATRGSDLAGSLYNELGYHLSMTAAFGDARDAFKRALVIGEETHGPDHPTVAIDVSNLGTVLRALGDLEDARAACERALTINEKIYGPDHPTVATCVNNLGNVLWDQGDLEGARAACERALTINEKTQGPDHPTVATFVNNLGAVLQDQGDLEGARAACERALTISEKTYGPDHPTVANRVNNLGSVLRAQGDLEGARTAFERALAIGEKTYGPNHPTVANRVNNLGNVLWDQGDLEGARAAFERALGIFEARLGPDHPSTIKVRQNLLS